MKCPKWNSAHHIKRGKINGKQRYSCKVCSYNDTVLRKKTSKPDSLKRKALQFYLEGLGFRSIGRFLGVSHVSVYQWIKPFGAKLESIKSNKKIGVVEIDEMHTYIAHKKTIVG